jgi:glycosyltransferase involved in cell wall biosynthesis
VNLLRAMMRPAVRAVRRRAAVYRARHASVGGESTPGEIRAYYGYRVPTADRHEVGGIVKLQELQRAFGNSPNRFNLLYLVSSRLPEEAVTLASIAKDRGARVVINQNGVAYPGWHGPGWEAVNRPMAELLSLADHVFYQSRFCKESADRFVGRPRGGWEILYNAVDPDRFQPDPSRRDADGLTLLLGGSQDSWYRLEVALRVLAKVARARARTRLLVTGRLPKDLGRGALSEANALAARLGVQDRVSFLGPYTQRDAPAIFQRADILLHTKYNDPCPTVVLEAMASALPVVYSSSGGVPELVGDDAGIGIPAEASWDRDDPPDPDRMADAVLRIADLRTIMGEAARRRAVARFHRDAWIERHRVLFSSLVTGVDQCRALASRS